jgi:hypothetical protein
MPRWEWRSFAPSFDAFRQDHPELSVSPAVTSQDVCLLCRTSTHDVQIQDGAVRLKWRKETGPGGLEMWDPVLSAGFPCSPMVVARLFEAWGLPVPKLERSEYTQAQFLELVRRHTHDIYAVGITKQSETFQLDGVSGEFARLTIRHARVECLSMEHEDPGLTLQVIARLGLRARGNTSYPQGLKDALRIHPTPRH